MVWLVSDIANVWGPRVEVGRKLRVSGPINFSNTLICLRNVCKLSRTKKMSSDHSLSPGSEKLPSRSLCFCLFFLGGGAYLRWHGKKVITAVTHHTSNLSIRLWSNKYTNNSTLNPVLGLFFLLFFFFKQSFRRDHSFCRFLGGVSFWFDQNISFQFLAFVWKSPNLKL